MKQYLFLATAIATASLFTGCSNNEYVGDQPEAFNGTDGAIAFSMGKANTTRGTLDAATSAGKLGNTFYVYGKKNVNTAESPTWRTVFNTYKVQYKPSESSASNTTGWEYVGNLWDNGGYEKTNVRGEVVDQTIKYWDYSASQYTFYAFSANLDDVKTSDPKIKVVEFNPTTEQYIVKIKENAQIDKLYFADKKIVPKAEYAGKPNTTAQETAVKLTFRNLASKVRFGFYETVPGYSIQITKMYKDDNGTEASDFAAICPNIQVLRAPSQITVKYKPENDGAYPNYAYVASIKDYNATSESGVWQSAATFEHDGVFHNTTLSKTSAAPTWYDNSGDYTFVWPQEDNNTPLKIKVNYTLTSTDGSNEQIIVKGATAQIPVEYVKWKANTAYTYIFKISDKTNGSTGEGGPEGLYPITFDAVVQDYANEGFTTTVSTPSVTASQDGATFVSPDNGIRFALDKDIFLKVMNGGSEVTDVTIKSAYVTSYDYAKSPVQNLGTTGWNNDVNYDGTNKYYKLEKQTENGWWILEVKDSGTLTTATTYVIIRVGDAEEGPANS